jgi:soluble lytic murein transglycosylase-like protein
MQTALRIAFSFALLLSAISLIPQYAAASASKAAQAQKAYFDLITEYAGANGVPVGLARAVVKHESGFNPEVTGRAGEIGLMQIKLSTARGMGYKGTAKGLYEPATNLRWGMKYLGQAQKLAGGSECGTLSRYNGGHGTKRMIKSYCGKVQLAKD